MQFLPRKNKTSSSRAGERCYTEKLNWKSLFSQPFHFFLFLFPFSFFPFYFFPFFFPFSLFPISSFPLFLFCWLLTVDCWLSIVDCLLSRIIHKYLKYIFSLNFCQKFFFLTLIYLFYLKNLPGKQSHSEINAYSLYIFNIINIYS